VYRGNLVGKQALLCICCGDGSAADVEQAPKLYSRRPSPLTVASALQATGGDDITSRTVVCSSSSDSSSNNNQLRTLQPHPPNISKVGTASSTGTHTTRATQVIPT
jgi:hypothetical protein